MQKTLLFFAITAALGRGAALGQVVQPVPVVPAGPVPIPGGYAMDTYASGTYDKGATPFGDYVRGIGDLIRSKGRYNLDTSAAAINYTEAQRRAIENWRLWTQTYFDLRRMNREYRANERPRRPTMEDLVRYAQMGRPQRLTPSELDTVTGEVFWPVLLRAERLGPYRTELQAIFDQRAAAGVLGAEEYMNAGRLIDYVHGILRDHIHELPPGEYLAAMKFLDSLNYEASLPTG